MKTIILTILFLSLAIGVSARDYTTTFPLTENPISEGGNWLNGKTDGRDWLDVLTASGNASGADNTLGYNDPTAIVTGTWGADHWVQATVWIGSRPGGTPEVEIRLRSSISTGVNSGYEILYSIASGSTYHQIVRWNSALGDFTYLCPGAGCTGSTTISQINDGDVVKATIVGNTITTYINDVQKLQVSDSTFSSGSPGIGFYGGTGMTSFGFKDFFASDGAQKKFQGMSGTGVKF